MADRPDRDPVLTEEGLRLLVAELDHLRGVRRAEVASRIREALEFGDAWENPEYEAAKTEQAFVEGRIAELESLLHSAKLVGETSPAGDVVALGTWVRFRDLESGEENEYCIVGALEADPLRSRISNMSPVAQAILGHRVGERVSAQVPAGVLQLEITAVRPAEPGFLPPGAETARPA
ncbi:MAG: transcription elongation factor GreA [Chitinophagales bacterium]